MAEMVVSPLVKALIGDLASVSRDELQLLGGVDEEIDKVTGKLEEIRDFLIDAEEKQVTHYSIKNWLKQLRDAAYEAEDIVEEFTTNQLLKKINKKSKVRKFFSPSCACFKQVTFLHEVGQKIKEVREKIDEILKYGSRLDLTRGVMEKHTRVERPKIGHCVIESEIHGREDDKKKIVDMLLSGANEEQLSVFPIVGMGGLGKTTLAQLVYNDEQITGHFDKRIWVCVSVDKFDEAKLINSIIESVTGNKCELSEISLLQSTLERELRGKKYLLVLDDVWDDDLEKWARFLTPFRTCGAKGGGKILVTTRLRQVADAMRVRDPYFLQGLSDENCWLVFKAKAFSEGEDEEFPNLVEIGREIVNK